MKPLSYWVTHLDMLPHPEGGYYKEVYRSAESIPEGALPARFQGNRSFATGIYFMITSENFSAFHRLQADELWHHYAGDAVRISLISPDGRYSELRVGNDPEKGEAFQVVVPAGYWFAAEVATEGSYSLVGCTVAPGFDFADFEMGKREVLLEEYPHCEGVIGRLTRG